MRCDEAAEFVSALYDGETVPREAAGHIGDCPACQAQLHAYMQMGLELRRMASLEIAEEAAPQSWKAEAAQQGKLKQWWQKGWETMRIPRFAFAAMVAGILVLASGLAITKVRARSEGSALILRVAVPGDGNVIPCPMSAVDKKMQDCGFTGWTGQGSINFQINLLSVEDDHVELGVRTAFVRPQANGQKANFMKFADIEKLPQVSYAFSPGTSLKVNVPGLGDLTLTGEWLDHMPAMLDQEIDPKANELRITNPILLKNQKSIADFEGGSGIAGEPGQAVGLYVPGEGQFNFSLTQMPNSVEAKANLNRISFESDGQSYQLLAAAPVSRSGTVWVQHKPGFTPERGLVNALMIGTSTAKARGESSN